MPRPLSRRRFVLHASIAIALGLFGPLAVFELVLRLLPVTEWVRIQSVTAEDPYIHYKPHQDHLWSVGWNFQLINRVHVNRQGFVNDQDYDPTAKAPLLVVVGDSFVEALLVPYAKTLQGRLASIVGAAGRVYSFGISGAPLSQYLAYAEHARKTYQPSGMVIVIVGNDFDESLFEYKSAPGFHYLKRREDGVREMVLVPYYADSSWLKSAARASALFRYLYPLGLQEIIARIKGQTTAMEYVGRAPAQAHAMRIERSKEAVDFFLTQLPRYSGLPENRIALLVDGMRPELYDAEQLALAERSYFGVMRRYFMTEAQRRGYPTMDMQERFIARHGCDGARFEWGVDQHWNSNAHEEVMFAALDSAVPAAVFGPLPRPSATTCHNHPPSGS